MDVDGSDVAIAADAFCAVQNLLRENEAISSYDKQVGADGLELCVDAGRFFRGPLQA